MKKLILAVLLLALISCQKQITCTTYNKTQKQVTHSALGYTYHRPIYDTLRFEIDKKKINDYNNKKDSVVYIASDGYRYTKTSLTKCE